MNKRIQLLATKNALYVDGGNGKTNYTFTKESMEELVELIVRECADHIMSSSDRYRKEYFADRVLELLDD